MRRREFVTLLGGAAAAWPLTARAQQATALPIVGFLRSEPLGDAMHLVAAFRAGLKEAGFTEDQNVIIELRSAEGQADRLTALVAELIHRPVAVIVANSLAAVAAATATSRVPIVFATGTDPVRDHLVTSLNHPGRKRDRGGLLRQQLGCEATGTAAAARSEGNDYCSAR
jgi:putative ABC transport system substrate-binding protein